MVVCLDVAVKLRFIQKCPQQQPENINDAKIYSLLFWMERTNERTSEQALRWELQQCFIYYGHGHNEFSMAF